VDLSGARIGYASSANQSSFASNVRTGIADIEVPLRIHGERAWILQATAIDHRPLNLAFR
jgi:hypothetical protein